MKLKYQLLLLALLSLLFPITGWLALKSVDKEFRLTIEQASKNTLLSLKASVQQMLQSDPNFELDGLIPEAIDNFILDGDSNEWDAITAYTYQKGLDKLVIKIASDDIYLYMLIESNDATIDSYSLDSDKNDQIIIALADDRGLYKYYFQRQAEGFLSKKDELIEKPEYQAYWHEKSQGFVMEVRFKNLNIHHVGFATINQSLQKTTTGTLNTAQTLKLLPIISINKSFQAAISNITPENNHFSILDNQKRIIYQSNKLPSNQNVSQWQWMITPIYRWLFGINEENKMSNKWFYRQEDGMAGIKHSIQANDVTYELNSMMPQGQQSMIQTLLKAGVLMIAVVLLLMLAYLGYSLFLAWRIKKLNKAMQTVLDDSGRLHIQMPSHNARDEIGQLSRGIESMLSEMREYTQYLKDLGSRLSHEMKTPLAVVQSSLDNLELEQRPEFLQRAQLGTKRLRFTLNQLSELSRLKYTLEQTPKQVFDIALLVQELAQAYQGFIPNLKMDIHPEPLMIEGSPDLMAQMIDKLLDNAKDFISKNGYIELSIFSKKDKVNLTIFNTDSQLPVKKGLNIFNSLVSVRNDKTTDSVHLGLGLYLVQLISRYHNTTIKAENTHHPKGVIFTIEFNQSTTL